MDRSLLKFHPVNMKCSIILNQATHIELCNNILKTTLIHQMKINLYDKVGIIIKKNSNYTLTFKEF